MKSKKEKMSPQAERTKRHLKEAYIELINEKGYSHVSVTDIVHRAQYNRATFYLYYLDKFHLTEELLEEMFRQIKRTSTERYKKGADVLTSAMDADSFELIRFVYDNRSFFNLYLAEDTIPGLHGELPQAIFEMLDEGFTFEGIHSDHINSQQFKRYMAYGTSGLILEWAKTGYEKSPKEMTGTLIDIVRSFATAFRFN
ncbi:TetR/AcrR family transcriptional regulator [Planococcus maritimus]|uniref:TetR/AcrR family transcriptional regulator n=1 Tax=Planococcus maritimus TaxID=192421 RepID=UPI00079ADD65|nr:TetR/AcrR family transcriptional regulator [Planococcus maritimus]KYG58350.1 hypothetical protein AY633_08720 [Planococcus maritimus]